MADIELRTSMKIYYQTTPFCIVSDTLLLYISTVILKANASSTYFLLFTRSFTFIDTMIDRDGDKTESAAHL